MAREWVGLASAAAHGDGGADLLLLKSGVIFVSCLILASFVMFSCSDGLSESGDDNKRRHGYTGDRGGGGYSGDGGGSSHHGGHHGGGGHGDGGGHHGGGCGGGGCGGGGCGGGGT
ncbi:hypothetical protein BT93_L4320 [Corymbia citriodora subsp. variegata]|uniref:Glycine-rich protein n=1 Tax=Corymbia citriodora subsp. variegata TaxID=360336 RepID=A0A8T0CUR9_CORYI|nr:hypothetical protein BT93_L4320 [Corymbia citriodora subsp. variegata]